MDEPLPEAPAPRNDNSQPAPGARLTDDLLMGLRFYSRLPTGPGEHGIPELSRIAMALPFTSIVIALLPAALLAAAAALGVPGYFAATLGVAALVVVTGAMAEDGLADAADGLFGGADPQRRLEIFKDSRHGTYGVCALVLFLLARVTGLGWAVGSNPLAVAALWIAATMLARSGALWLTVALPPARADGASAAAGRVGRRAFAIGAAFALVLAFVLAAPLVGVLGLVLALVLSAAIAAGWTWLCRRLVGGQTGDLIGALQALLEVGALTAFLIFL